MSPRARTVQERREATQARRARRAEVTDPGIVMEDAAAFLAVRQRSVEETRRRLNHLGYPSALCDDVVERLIELGYLDDHAFAQAWVESRDRAKPRGAVALRRELYLKGIHDDVIVETLEARSAQSDAGPESAGDADRIAASNLIERKRASLRREADPRKRRQKAYALLVRNGFSPDVCREVASLVAEDDETD